MKTIFFATFISLLISITFCKAQNGIIKGTVTVITKQTDPVPYAHVVAFTKNSIAIDSAYTDFNGNYSIKLPKGNYQIKINYLGFLPFSSEKLKIRNNEVKNLNIILEPTSVPLKMDAISHPMPKQEEKK